jgi:SOS-response transcriptional repressor LexA
MSLGDTPEGAAMCLHAETPAQVGDIVGTRTAEHGGVVKRLSEKEGRLFLVGNNSEPIPVDDSAKVEGPVIFIGRFRAPAANRLPRTK